MLPLIRQIEECVEREKLYAAGFISYEAAPAFDPSLTAKTDGEFPLLWFGLFRQIDEITLLYDSNERGASIAWQPSITRNEYDRCLHRIRTHLSDGDTYQVNFTYRLRATTDVDPWRLFVKIAGDGEAPFGGFVDTSEWAICSASPELFIRIDGNHIESRPMKGTAARGLWFEDDQAKKETLMCSEKERAENLMIVDMVRNDLSRVALTGSVQVPSLFRAEKYPTLWQLTSTVVARTCAPIDRILQAVFPPASITGAPKRSTMEIIADLESSPRRIYTGTIGFIAPGRRAQLNVAICTVLLDKSAGRAEYGVGGGIVWDSTPSGEYEESLTKTKVLSPLPRDFDLLETMLWSPGTGYSLLEYHLTRLSHSAEYFGFKVDLRKVRVELASIVAGLPQETYKVRMFVSRMGKIRCETSALKSASLRFGDVVLAKEPIDVHDVFLYHKTTRREVYEDAIRMCPVSDDVLLFNDSRHVTETTRANIAVEIDGVLYTPPVGCGLLSGTQRAMMLEHGLLQERIISIQEMLSSPNVYLLNSIRGIHKVHIRE
ncbi:MAG TPA: aminodeoxychorismate synthase component I [Deltaproteobacteria bacterium]|nr:aminodeoxychorismate synthase component I [Deltaproteobacteria bacterium]